MAKIGKYELVRQLATGGMAEVFLAKTEGALGFEKTVVVKRIRQHLLDDPQFVQMFLQEAKLAAQLNHPNIAQVFDFGESDGTYYLAMEHVDGPNLRTLSTEAHKAGKPISFPLCAKIISYAAEGLAFAHEFVNPKTQQPLNIVHRDVSPDNVVLARNGAVKVVDFGIAKAAEQVFQTQSGLRKGKLAYMSPEYLKGEPPDRRADVFALGVVLYELISNKKPYNAESEVTLINAMISEPMVPVRARRSDVPEELETILERTLTRDREARYPSCRELQADLERYIVSAGEPLSSVHISKVIAGLQPELDAAALAKTPNRGKSTPSGKTPSGQKTPPKKATGSSGPKKATGSSGEKPKPAAPPRQLTAESVDSEDRTARMNGPEMVAKAVAVYGEGASNEATVRMNAKDLDVPAPVAVRKLEPAPKPEPEQEEKTEERTSPALDVRAVLPPAPAAPSPKRAPERTETPRAQGQGLMVTQKQLMAAGAAVLALMLLSAALAMVLMRKPEPPPPPPPPPAEKKADAETPPPDPIPVPEPVKKPPERPKDEEPRVAIEITSNLPAVVKIGKRKGKPTPYRGELPPGKYEVELDDSVTGFWMKRL
ncbi:MAG TPA: protein kinase, partial [Myxococcaceae bacterium]